MRWILSISAALGLAAVSSGVGGVQAPDKFTLACPLPFDPSACIGPLTRTARMRDDRCLRTAR